MINILHFLFFLAISPAKAVNCIKGRSHDCCWVVQAWQEAGKSASYDSDKPRACCDGSFPGVSCETVNSVPRVRSIDWLDKQLTAIPPALGMLSELSIL
jgi:hypothetical protein